MGVRVLVARFMVRMRMAVRHAFVNVLMRMFVSVPVLMGKMDIELYPFDAGLAPARYMQVIAFESQFSQLPLQCVSIHAQINQRADEHVATDAAEDVQVQCFHLSSAVNGIR